MREIDVAHQPENQGEAGGDQKIQSAERDAVEHRVEEQPLLAEDVLKARRPGREDQPQRHSDREQDDQRPERMAFDKCLMRAAHLCPCPEHRRRHQTWCRACSRGRRSCDVILSFVLP